MGLISGKNRSSWIVIHARSETVSGCASLPAESVGQDIAGLSCQEPFNIKLEIVVDVAEELNKLCVRLLL